jgi:hypothetical protein|tara:strand:+ start:44 stop:232 length:189 start_codon:yes stop_codon:yes gene_type:complete
MTKHKISEIHGLASNGLMRPELASNIIAEVCEAALELFKTVEQQKAQLAKCQRAHSPKYVPE